MISVILLLSILGPIVGLNLYIGARDYDIRLKKAATKVAQGVPAAKALEEQNIEPTSQAQQQLQTLREKTTTAISYGLKSPKEGRGGLSKQRLLGEQNVRYFYDPTTKKKTFRRGSSAPPSGYSVQISQQAYQVKGAEKAELEAVQTGQIEPRTPQEEKARTKYLLKHPREAERISRFRQTMAKVEQRKAIEARKEELGQAGIHAIEIEAARPSVKAYAYFERVLAQDKPDRAAAIEAKRVGLWAAPEPSEAKYSSLEIGFEKALGTTKQRARQMFVDPATIKIEPTEKLTDIWEKHIAKEGFFADQKGASFLDVEILPDQALNISGKIDVYSKLEVARRKQTVPSISGNITTFKDVALNLFKSPPQNQNYYDNSNVTYQTSPLDFSHSIEKSTQVKKLIGSGKDILLSGSKWVGHSIAWKTSELASEAVKRPVSTALTFYGIGKALQWIGKGTVAIASKVDKIAQSPITQKAIGGTAVTLGLGALIGYDISKQTTKEEKISALVGDVGTLGIFYAAGRTTGALKQRFFSRSKTEIYTDIHKQPISELEKTAVTHRRTNLMKINTEPVVDYTVQGKRVTPKTYSDIMVSEGRLSEIKYPNYLGDTQTLGEYTLYTEPPHKIEIALGYGIPEKSKLQLTTPNQRRTTLAHELIHVKSLENIPSKILKFENPIPYRFKPSELVAYGLESYYSKKGFKVTPEQVNRYLESNIDEWLIKKGSGLEIEYPRMKLLERSTGKNAPTVAISTGYIEKASKAYEMIGIQTGRRISGSIKSLEYDIAFRKNKKGDIISSVFTKEGEFKGSFKTKYEPEKIDLKISDPIVFTKKTGQKSIDVGKKISESDFYYFRNLEKIGGYTAEGEATEFIGWRDITRRFLGKAKTTLQQSDYATLQKELTTIGKKKIIELKYPDIEYALNPIYKPNKKLYKELTQIGEFETVEPITEHIRRPKLITKRVSKFVSQTYYSYERSPVRPIKGISELIRKMGKKGELRLGKDFVKVETIEPKIEVMKPTDRPILSGKEIDAILNKIEKRPVSIFSPIATSKPKGKLDSEPDLRNITEQFILAKSKAESKAETWIETRTEIDIITKAMSEVRAETKARTKTRTYTKSRTSTITQALSRTITAVDVKIPTMATATDITPIIPKIPPIELRKKTESKRKPSDERFYDEDLVYIPDFTSRELDLRFKVSKKALSKQLQTEFFTGFETRKLPVIN